MPTPTPIVTKKAPEPWVNGEEIAQAKKMGRILLVFSPDELADLKLQYGLDSIRPYVGRWLKVSNEFRSLKIEDVNKYDYKAPNRYGYLVVQATYKSLGAYMLLYFDREKWEERILSLRSGDKVDAICQFVGFYETQIGLTGINCELSQLVK